MLLILTTTLLGSVLASAGNPAFVADDSPPFTPGEAFTFQIRWGLLKVGEATLGIRGPVDFDGAPAYHIFHSARTRGFVDAFYRVRNQVDSFMSLDGERALHYTKEQREGRSERDVVVYFDWDEHTAKYTDGDHSEEPVDIDPNTHDPLSIVYAARYLPFEQGVTYSIPVSDGRRFFLAELTVTDRDEIKTKVGTFDAILVEADTKDLGGVFERSGDNTIRFWVSNDDRRLPLMMISRVSIGSFRAELIAIDHLDE